MHTLSFIANMYFRNTKNRIKQSQDTIRAATTKALSYTEASTVYEHTYNIPLPDASHDILLSCIRGLTGGMSAPNMEMRSLHTIGVWCNAAGVMCRCAFIQPEIASATCTIPASKLQAAKLAKHQVVYDIPYAEECRVGTPAGRVEGTPQISGRMAPYVVSKARIDNHAQWGFGNLCKSKLLFLVSSDQGYTILCPTRVSIALLKPYMPSYAACIYDDGMSCYRITVSPDAGNDTSDANKNTSLILYGDGALKVQGTPSKMEQVCLALHHSLHEMSRHASWERFLMSMTEITVLEPSHSLRTLPIA